ncbi:DUF4476 domain-containing protein [Bacteroides salyersiae]|jgi:hypothetical protein|uniref:DUF4476 domain-containing protein n=1 Tax=Bacteroides salyersiae TaxID=291644 RepID=UPI001C8BDFF6|nr:DUF4476 domain-containing protein [Bacteroides salyersiae]
MIRKLILGFCFLLAMLPASAFSLEGLSVESPREQVVVFIDGKQVCRPTYSCFIANLHGGSYRVEVYAVRRGNRFERENLLFDERVYCSGREVKEIVIDGPDRPEHRPGRPDKPGHRPDGFNSREPVMSDSSFNQFMSSLKKQPFESDRNALLDNALINSYFTTDQCIRLLEFYTFDSEKKPFLKKIYPRIADKANFFRALDKLTFSSDKEEVNQFIKVYHENNN